MVLISKLTVQLGRFANVHNGGWTAAVAGSELHARAQGVSVVAVYSEFDVAPPATLYLSAAADFVVSQVVDDVKGVHCRIRKADFAPWH